MSLPKIFRTSIDIFNHDLQFQEASGASLEVRPSVFLSRDGALLTISGLLPAPLSISTKEKLMVENSCLFESTTTSTVIHYNFISFYQFF